MYGIKTIELNKDYYYLTPDHHELIDTILHEIAHALHFKESGKTGHTEGWRRVCVRIGAEPNRLTEDAVMPTIKTRKISDNRANFEID